MSCKTLLSPEAEPSQNSSNCHLERFKFQQWKQRRPLNALGPSFVACSAKQATQSVPIYPQLTSTMATPDLDSDVEPERLKKRKKASNNSMMQGMQWV